MWQASLWDDSGRIVNVASVPQRSPFRYPGGKTWLVPRIRRWLASLPIHPSEFIEPFAGGAIIGLTVAAEGLASQVTLAELDEAVAAVWQTIINDEGGAEWLAERITGFNPTLDTVKAALAEAPRNKRETAFQTILKNRVNRGGILAPGAGLVKTGEAGRGLLSRWYPETLKRRILEIVRIRDRITFKQSMGWKSYASIQNVRRRFSSLIRLTPLPANTQAAGCTHILTLITRDCLQRLKRWRAIS
jgi:DNA adenine methylase